MRYCTKLAMYGFLSRSRGALVSGPVIRENTLQLFVRIYPDMDEESFKASSGWLQKNCLRHGIRAM